MTQRRIKTYCGDCNQGQLQTMTYDYATQTFILDCPWCGERKIKPEQHKEDDDD